MSIDLPVAKNFEKSTCNFYIIGPYVQSLSALNFFLPDILGIFQTGYSLCMGPYKNDPECTSPRRLVSAAAASHLQRTNHFLGLVIAFAIFIFRFPTCTETLSLSCK